LSDRLPPVLLRRPPGPWNEHLSKAPLPRLPCADQKPVFSVPHNTLPVPVQMDLQPQGPGSLRQPLLHAPRPEDPSIHRSDWLLLSPRSPAVAPLPVPWKLAMAADRFQQELEVPL